MNEIEKQIIELINEYINCSSYFFNIIKDNYQIDKEGILRSRRLNLIPKNGTIGDIDFNFHGGGCFFETSNDNIDVDLGPNDRTDGFDFDRIKNFSKSRIEKYPALLNEIQFKKGFDNLIKKGVISNPAFYPNPHLFYFKNSINKEYSSNDSF